ncbi:MAG: hypothetical protein IJ416_07905 [Ruminiclostridium sp.]|nr:hypothetical protein [Ruminiclostridium sp.]
MEKFRKFLGFIPALALSAALTFGAGAQGVVDDVVDGAENIVNDTVDTAEDILGGSDDTIGSSGDDSIVDSTDDDDIPDQLEDDADDPNSGKNENDAGANNSTEADPNPNTGVGIPFMTAGLIAVSAAGLAYLTRNREGFGKD